MRSLGSKAMLGALLGMGLIVTLLPTLADACAVCAGAEDQGYFWGVLFLMSMPFAVSSFIGGWLLYSYRRAQAGLSTSVPPLTVERRMPPPASMPSASDRPNGEPQAHRA
jgi:hypothetical protein